MKPKTFVSLSLVALTACAGPPRAAPIDDALLAEASGTALATVTEARAVRDSTADAYALAQSNTKKAQAQVDVARASAKTILSQSDESKLAVEIAASSGSPGALASARAQHTYDLANADYARDLLALRKRELELARLNETLALDEHRLAIAEVELKKAEALQEVDLIAAKKISIKDHRKQVTYHRKAVESARSRVRAAEAQIDELRGNLEDLKRKVDSLQPPS